MFQLFRKYRRLFAISTVAFYLLGGLQFPFLECLHFLSHLDDLATGHYDSHGFHSHDHSHQHQTLSMLDSLNQIASSEQLPVNETSPFSVKKFPQCFVGQPPVALSLPEKQAAVFAVVSQPNDAPASVPSPPPRA